MFLCVQNSWENFEILPLREREKKRSISAGLTHDIRLCLYTWLRLWHVHYGTAVWTLAGDRDNTHGFSRHGDVCKRCPDYSWSWRAHWHISLHHDCWKVRKKTNARSKTSLYDRNIADFHPKSNRMLSHVLCVGLYHLKSPELCQWLLQACHLLR